MGIKYNKKINRYIVTYCKRHPKTTKPISMTRRAKTITEARRFEKELMLLVEKKIQESVTPKWSHFVKQYYEYLLDSDVSTNTAETYYFSLKKNTVPAWGNRLIDSISKQEIRMLIKDQFADKSETFRKSLLKYIRGAFNHATDCMYLNFNPTPKITFKTGQKLETVLTINEAKTLLNESRRLGSKWYPIYAVALYTGMRSGEMYALTWDNVCFENNTIKVSRSWNNKDGFKDTKTGNDRLISINSELKSVLVKLMDSKGSEFVLPRLKKWTRGGQAKELRKLLTSLNLPLIRFHDLRATWATMMMSNGVPSFKVMNLGGWSDLKTMERYTRKAGVNIKGATDSLKLDDQKQCI